jgi:pyruvate dehydrogenase E2 component (dihydrolipoamide acetyltransferase)
LLYSTAIKDFTLSQETTETFAGHPGGASIPLTRIQKLIGERMLQSKRSRPCFYIEMKADVTELMGLRPKLRKTLGVRITTDAFFIRAAALAAKQYPLVLGKIDGDSIRIPDSINVGFAVNAPQGLVVPVIKEADKKTLAEIAGLEEILVEKGRDNKLTLENMEGQTIALSNLGAYGIDSFFAIVPLQTSAILAIGNADREIVPVDGKPEERKIVSVSLAADRRVIDEAYAAKFLNAICGQLQNPQTLV